MYFESYLKVWLYRFSFYLHADKNLPIREDDKSLWPQALVYFADKVAGTTSSRDATREFAEVLDVIDKENILSPLEVIQILAKNSAVTIGMVRNYLVKRMESEKKSIEEV